jgi:O-methyltransferase
MSQYEDLKEPEFIECHNLCQPFTMTSTDRLYSLFNAVRFVVSAKVEGDFVECGVWKGGSVMMMASVLRAFGVSDRTIYLFDTFEGMTAPTDADADQSGTQASELLTRSGRNDSHVWAYSPIDEVRSNLEKTGYPMDRFIFVKGDVCETIPDHGPDKIAILRLDTDWYESTRHELEFFFPRLVQRGVLILDDYGHWKGANKAVNEYFAAQDVKYLMHRIDYTGRAILKA